MAQYDLILIQNTHATGVELTERWTTPIAKGMLISADASSVPTILAAGTNGYHLVRDDNATTGLKWEAMPSLSQLHTQNTDTGTTSATFALASGSYNVKLKAESATKFGLRNAADNAYADLEGKTATFGEVNMVAGTITTAPSGANDIVNKAYADGLLATNDAMVFKGTIGTGGTHTIAAFNALTVYNAGWTYRVIEAGTIRGRVFDISDIGGLLSSTVDRLSGGVDADWVFVQTNSEGLVSGPTTATDSNFAIFNSTTGRIIKDSGYSASSFAISGHNHDTVYIAKATMTTTGDILYASSASTPARLAVGTNGQILKSNGTTPTWYTPGTMINEAASDYITKATLNATNTVMAAITANTPTPISMSLSSLLGRKASGDVTSMSISDDVVPLMWKATPPATKTSTGTAGWISKDDNYLYVCAATNTWKRTILATNW